MKLANLFFILGMASYFTLGKYDSTLWSNFYYTTLIAYLICNMYIDKKHDIDVFVGMLAVVGIWVLYLFKPFIVPKDYVWVRFYFGVSLGILGLAYLVFVLETTVNKLKNGIY